MGIYDNYWVICDLLQHFIGIIWKNISKHKTFVNLIQLWSLWIGSMRPEEKLKVIPHYQQTFINKAVLTCCRAEQEKT